MSYGKGDGREIRKEIEGICEGTWEKVRKDLSWKFGKGNGLGKGKWEERKRMGLVGGNWRHGLNKEWWDG